MSFWYIGINVLFYHRTNLTFKRMPGVDDRGDVDSELLVDTIFAPLYYRLLLRRVPLTQQYGDQLIDQVPKGVRAGARRD